jgi:hypothetical protein
MDYTYLHELEVVKLRSRLPRPVEELLPVFTSQGFTLHDDVVSLDRTGKLPPWQHPSVVEVEVLHKGDEVFGFGEGVWDTIELRYLFASLPIEYVNQFIDVVATTSDRLEITPEFEGQEIAVDALRLRFAGIRNELLSATGEDAGSEGLAILIQSTYPRR